MVTEGIIMSIDYASNKCTIRIPIFETASSTSKVIMEGRIAIQPGIYNGYMINDTVWVTFVDNELNRPLVIGKIYQGPLVEQQSKGNAIIASSLKLTGNNLEISKDTTLLNTDTQYNTIEKLIQKIRELEVTKNSLLAAIGTIQKEISTLSGYFSDMTLVDAEGHILADADGELLSPAVEESED